MSPEYFATRLRPYEAEAYLDGVDMQRRDRWEQTRRQAFFTLAPWSKNLDPMKFMPLPWDAESITPTTKEDIDEVKNWSAQVLANLKTNGQ